jgi:NAD(P)-dependent dehydrogenase (short-subunit alcohol dehydrogenase family)
MTVWAGSAGNLLLRIGLLQRDAASVPGMCPYVAAKHGVVGLTKAARSSHGVTPLRVGAPLVPQ